MLYFSVYCVILKATVIFADTRILKRTEDLTMFRNDSNEIVFFDVYGFHLRWTKQSFFSYLAAPRPNHGLMYVLCDRICVEYPDGDSEIFEKGNIVYIPEGLRYRVKFSGECEPLEALLVNFSAYGDLPTCNRITKTVTNATAECTDPFYKIIALYTQMKNYRYGVMEQFYRLLNQMSDRAAIKDQSAYESILPAISYANSHVGERIRVPELARLCLLSESAFRKRFYAYTGKTPNKYITDLKLEKAKELLKSTDIPIEAIVSELSFYDSAYFHKVFKRQNGVSPSVYRDKVSG